MPDFPSYTQWLKASSPEFEWDWPHLQYVRQHLADVTLGRCRKLAISWAPQHGKTEATTVRYPLWRMLREPGIRVGVASYNQTFTNKQSRKTRRLARRLKLAFGEPDMVNEWQLANGSTYIARGAGAGLAGEPLDLLLIDDPHKNRKEADSPTVQERVYEWYMDDVTPRIQKAGAVIVIATRWNPGDLIGRIQDSEEAPEWRFLTLKAIAEADDPIGRQPGEALCPARFTIEALEAKRRSLGVGFESLYQQNPIVRGGSFFKREWFPVVDRGPGVPLKMRRVRYWDLASGRSDSSCYTAGVLMCRCGDEYWIEDVVRGRWGPAERNEVMRRTAASDATLPGFERTWFENPIFDKGGDVKRAVIKAMAGFPVAAHDVSGAGGKEVRAEPLADAAKGGIVKVVAGPYVSAMLSELEAFPKSQYKDQVDSLSGGFVMLARGGGAISMGGKAV